MSYGNDHAWFFKKEFSLIISSQRPQSVFSKILDKKKKIFLYDHSTVVCKTNTKNEDLVDGIIQCYCIIKMFEKLPTDPYEKDIKIVHLLSHRRILIMAR